MPKSKRNKTVDLCKTKKHGLEGKKELYKKIQSNVENYAHVFVFAVNDMRNSKMKNVREQWKHSRFCIGKNKVMAMALGRTPEEEYRPNLHQIGQMLIGERGLLFTNQSIDEVVNWFQSYSEGDYARSGNVATEDVIMPEGPLAQFPHNLESYLRQLGLPTTLKKGVIHLIKEHVVCTEGDRLSPETARILKLLGYEMAEFRIKVLSVWSQDGSFVNLQPDSYDPESKENAATPKVTEFELTKDSHSLGNENEMEIAEDDSAEKSNEISNISGGDMKLENVMEDLDEDIKELKIVKQATPKGKKSLPEAKRNSGDGKFLENEISSEIKELPKQLKSKQMKNKSKAAGKVKQVDADDTLADSTNSEEKVSDQAETEVKNSSPTKKIETEDDIMEMEVIQEPEVKKPKNDSTVKRSVRKSTKTVNKQAVKIKEGQTNEEVITKEEIVDSVAILKLTEKKLEESAEKPKKFSPKMTRARAAAANKKIKTPEPIESKRTARKRKM